MTPSGPNYVSFNFILSHLGPNVHMIEHDIIKVPILQMHRMISLISTHDTFISVGHGPLGRKRARGSSRKYVKICSRCCDVSVLWAGICGVFTFDWIISGARYSGVPQRVQVLSVIT